MHTLPGTVILTVNPLKKKKVLTPCRTELRPQIQPRRLDTRGLWWLPKVRPVFPERPQRPVHVKVWLSGLMYHQPPTDANNHE